MKATERGAEAEALRQAAETVARRAVKVRPGPVAREVGEILRQVVRELSPGMRTPAGSSPSPKA